MSRTCDVCGKSLMYGHKVSNSYNHTKRTWRPNIHKVKAIVEGTTRTINVCANCIRSDYIDKKVRMPKDVRTALAEQDKKAAEAQ
ncbi:50S ribosomal protein L28 [Treponema socranskii subsp. buccale]|uniref:50S ribosomal protein L28 n=1 Tax=Treponema socranskii TaxID=53419 RepID=UPI0020A4199C|nr:50S ribosomal protein L28 [Treponema socranskii]UTD03312.1 50S ribosomal protein L28 [Treponema socranskii subsp. buccale]